MGEGVQDLTPHRVAEEDRALVPEGVLGTGSRSANQKKEGPEDQGSGDSAHGA